MNNKREDYSTRFDRWLALRQTTEKFNRRAGTLNAMEQLRLEKATRQIDYKLHMSETHYTKVCDRLKDSLKHQDLYRRALSNKGHHSHEAGGIINSTMTQSGPAAASTAGINKPLGHAVGRYSYYSTRSVMAEDLKQAELDIQARKRRRNAVLLEKCRKESEVLIDPRVPTHRLFTKNKDKPLSERFSSTVKTKLCDIKPKTQSVVAFAKVRETLAMTRKQKQLKKVRRNRSKGIFQTEVTDL